MENKEKNKVEKFAIVRGNHVGISRKQAVSICKFISRKNPKEAIELLEKVLQKKIAVPMHYEVPHRHNMPKGQVAGRYPQNSSRAFITMLKNLIANASQKGMNEKELIIIEAQTNKAPTPTRGTRMAYGRKKFKRCHVMLKAVESKPNTKKQKKIEIKHSEVKK